MIGCGEAFDDRLPNTSLLVRAAGETVLLDCGYSVPPEVWKAEPDANAISLIWLSHAHADHYFGMPALLGRMWEEGRTAPLTVMSQPSVLEMLEQTLELGYRTLRKRYAFELKLCPPSPEFHDLRLRFAPTNHSSSNLAIRMDANGTSMGYSGDGAMTDASRELAGGANVWVQEAWSFDPSPVHADIPGVIASAHDVYRLAFVHVSRHVRRGERQRLFETMISAPVRCLLPEPGAVIPAA